MKSVHVFKFLIFITAVTIVSGCQWQERIDINSAGEIANDVSYQPATSADGRFVAFMSKADNLVPNDTNVGYDVFVRDTATSTITRVNLDNEGNEADRGDVYPYPHQLDISSDGRYVAFQSWASNLGGTDVHGWPDIFVRDREAGTTQRVNLGPGDAEDSEGATDPTISDDGRYVAFVSHGQLVAGDTDANSDVFVRDRQTGATICISVDSNGNHTGHSAGGARISGNGRYVVFRSQSAILVEGDTNGMLDIFVHDLQTGETTRVSVDSGGNQGNGHSDDPDISADGRYVAFLSEATNLAANDSNPWEDVFVHDRMTGTTTLVNVDSAGNSWPRNAEDAPSLSADGRHILFKTAVVELRPTYPPTYSFGYSHFVFDQSTLTSSPLYRSQSAPEGYGRDAVLSGDGRYVAHATSGDVFIVSYPGMTIDSVTPDMLPIGATTTVTITGSNFLSEALPGAGGSTFSNVTVVDPYTITADVTVSPDASSGSYNVGILLLGTGPGAAKGSSASCVKCVTYF